MSQPSTSKKSTCIRQGVRQEDEEEIIHRRVQAETSVKRRTTRASQREESDEEFELEKQGYKKKSNVKRPIDQERRGNQQKHRKRQCWIVCFKLFMLINTYLYMQIFKTTQIEKRKITSIKPLLLLSNTVDYSSPNNIE